ncbi:MAG: MFS transporter [Proteobacteria bacterium]|nr:MFS transporter [Pseudomonadota bacterium]
MTADTAGATRSAAPPLWALVVGQICLHSCMAGVRMAAPLEVLGQGGSPARVGLLMGLFAAAPVVLALRAGRLADRHGYHLPLRLAVGLTVAGGLLAWVSTTTAGYGFLLLCVGAAACGTGANVGLITIQHRAGRAARDATELKRVFSWLGLAPALSNVAGPVLAGAAIDAAGFRAAFFGLAMLPLIGLWSARYVPAEASERPAVAPRRRSSWTLLRAPGLARLLLVNWLLSASWDVHSFVVPLLGHERGFSASAIGLVLGLFAAAVALVRLVIPMLAERLREQDVLVGAMLATATVFMLYPFARLAWLMGLCAALLGFALGSVQPMVMSMLHQMTPHDRHGEVIALRSMTLNTSSALMPLAFGVVGSALGPAVLFWLMGLAVGAGSWQARRVGAVSAAPAAVRT